MPRSLYYIGILLIFCSVCPAKNKEQAYRYEVIVGRRSAGELVAIRQVQGEFSNYKVKSELSVSFLEEYNILTVLNNRFSFHDLLASEYVMTVNGKDRNRTITTRRGEFYFIEQGDTKHDLRFPHIQFTTAMLYFVEPNKVKDVYSENHGRFLSIDKVTMNRYRLTLPDGKSTFYTYENGKCVLIESTQKFVKISFRKK